MRLLYTLMMASLIVGCQSEVDKCVTSQMKSWKAVESKKENQISKYEKDNNEIARTSDNTFTMAEAKGLVPTLDKRTVAEVEAEARVRCLLIINR